MTKPMRQDINLYKPFKNPNIDSWLLNWKQFWLANLAFSVFFLIAYIIFSISNQLLEKKNIELSNQAEKLKNEFYAVKKTYPSIFFKKDVAKTIEDLNKEISSQEKLLQNIVNRTFLSSLLITLSHSISKDCWLTKIDINNNSSDIILTGNGLSMLSINSFMKNLIKNQFFKSYILNINHIDNEPDPETKAIGFEITMVRRS